MNRHLAPTPNMGSTGFDVIETVVSLQRVMAYHAESRRDTQMTQINVHSRSRTLTFSSGTTSFLLSGLPRPSLSPERAPTTGFGS